MIFLMSVLIRYGKFHLRLKVFYTFTSRVRGFLIKKKKKNPIWLLTKYYFDLCVSS